MVTPGDSRRFEIISVASYLRDPWGSRGVGNGVRMARELLGDDEGMMASRLELSVDRWMEIEAGRCRPLRSEVLAIVGLLLAEVVHRSAIILPADKP